VESHVRTIAKALSWRLLATTVTFTVAWFVTGRFTLAAGIGVADALIKLTVYYFHERAWIRVKFGKLKGPEYEI
jgi:uncharacterized membrane protein